MRRRIGLTGKGLVILSAVVTVFALALTGGAAAYTDANGLETESLVEVTVPNRGALDALVGAGADLGESVRHNDDGTLTVQFYGTDDEIQELADAGYVIGDTIEDYNTYLARMAERQAAIDASQAARTAAETGEASGNLQAAGLRSAAFVQSAPEVVIQRVDYYESFAGRFLSVEAFNSATNGTGTSGPTLAMSWKEAGGSYGAATNMSRFTDTDPTPDVYLYHRTLIRLGGLGSTAMPAMVRVATSTSGVAPVEAPVNVWAGGGLPPFASGFLSHFFDHYMDATEGNDKINQLAAFNPTIAEIVETPAPTNGYRRKAMGTFTYANTTLSAASGAGATNIKVASVTNVSVGAAITVEPGTANAETRTIATVGTAGSGGTGVTVTSAFALAHASASVVFADLPIGNTATNTGSAVVFFSDQWDDNSVQVEFLNPGVADSPLSVSTLGKRIAVSLATNSSGGLSSTAAQVVAALNAHTAAAALVDTFTWAGNAGTGIVQPHALTNLSDFLNAPASVKREPFKIQALRIGKHRDGSKVGVFIYCEEHAREWVTPLVCLETADRLVRNYGIDPLTTELVDNLDIFVIPTINPDGTHYSFYNSSGQRRNMTNYCSVTTTSGMPSGRNSWGVDNNRNFSVGSLFDGYFGASSSCTSDTYSGPSELSEPENRSEISIPERFSNIKFSMNVHSSGGLFMWSPAAYTGNGRVALPYPNIGIEGYFWETAAQVLNRIKQYRGTVINPQITGPVIDVLYSAAGNSSDEMYYKFNLISYDFEVGADRQLTTLSAASLAGATNVKVASVAGFVVGAQINIDTRQPAATAELRTITAVGTTGAGGTGISFAEPLLYDHASGSEVLGGTASSGAGFMPNFVNEGQHEAMEFANGNYGILEQALAYQRDHEPPVATTVPAAPAASMTPMDVTFKWVNEASVIYYTLDGSTPTFASPTWEAQGARRPGEIFTFTHTTTVKWIAVDIVGNTSAVQSARFAIETDAPTTTAALSPAIQNGYYRAPFVTLMADDNMDGGGSGIASTEYKLDGAADWTVYSGPFQVSADGTHTLQFRSTDNAGNVEATNTITFNVDSTPPVISITTPPNNGSYLLNQAVNAAFSCSDALSGLALCSGSVANGSALPTNTVGWKTFSVSAADLAGNTSSETRNYNVHWPHSKFLKKPLSDSAAGKYVLFTGGDHLNVVFSLGGDRGMNILADGSPSSVSVNCASYSAKAVKKAKKTKRPSKPKRLVRRTGAEDFSPLQYVSGVEEYTFKWITDSDWAGTCRKLIIDFTDGTSQTAVVKFTK